MGTIVLERLQPDVLIRVLIAMEGCSTQEFAALIGINYRTVLDVAKGYSRCNQKLLLAISSRYSLNLKELMYVANSYNYKLVNKV